MEMIMRKMAMTKRSMKTKKTRRMMKTVTGIIMDNVNTGSDIILTIYNL